MFLAVLMSFYGTIAMTPALALAKSDHGNKENHGSVVRAVARSHSESDGQNHGSVVSAVARDNHGHGGEAEDDNDNENEQEDNNKNRNERKHNRNRKNYHATSTSSTATTTPDIVAPSILFATNIGSSASTTNLIWVTNESSDSKIWIGTTTPVATTTAPVASSSALSYFHNLSLPNLATSTLYYFTISSADSSGNTRFYSNSFTTPFAL